MISQTDIDELRGLLDTEAMELAAGLCQSEANRWHGTKPGEHWQNIATRLRGTAVAIQVFLNDTEAVREC